jgi:mono/diheme cytochrome c family protein
MLRWGAQASALALLLATGIGFHQIGMAQPKGNAKAAELVYRTECAKCHGPTGAGDGPEGQKLKEKPSNWTVAGGGGLKALDDDKIFAVIAEGGRAIGRSKGMPAYPKLSDDEIWNLVALVKTLGRK